MKELLFIVNAEGMVVHADEYARERFPEAAPGVPLFTIFPLEDQPHVRLLISRREPASFFSAGGDETLACTLDPFSAGTPLTAVRLTGSDTCPLPKLMNDNPCGMVLIDPGSMNIIEVNRTFCRLAGVEPDRFRGKKLFATEIAQWHLIEALTDELLAGRPSSPREVSIHHPEKGERVCLVNGSYTQTPREKRLLLVFFDVTDRKRSEGGLIEAYQKIQAELETRSEKLKKINNSLQAEIVERTQMEHTLNEERAQLSLRVQERTRQLEAINHELKNTARLKDRFFASITHELRSPLSAVIGFADGLLEGARGPLAPAQAEAMSIIRAHAERLLSTISSVLDISRIEGGMVLVENERVNLQDICAIAVRRIRAEAEEKQIAITIENDNPQFPIVTDQALVQKIVQHLLSNAIKFSPAKSPVVIGIQFRQQDRCVELSVKDSGIGISLDEQERVFSPFVQAEGGLSRGYEGIGLGLVIVRKLTELLGGSIYIESEPGKGSQFTVLLPFVPPGSGGHTPPRKRVKPSPQAEPLHVHAHTEAVLVADTNTIHLNMLRQYLTAKGFSVVTVRDIEQAFTELDTQEFCVIMIDSTLLRGEPDTIISRFRAHPLNGQTPIAVTGSPRKNLSPDAWRAAGADTFISKPFHLRSVIGEIYRLTGIEEPHELPS